MATPNSSSSHASDENLLITYAAFPGVLKSRMPPLHKDKPAIYIEQHARAALNQMITAGGYSADIACLALIRRIPVGKAKPQLGLSAEEFLLNQIRQISSCLTYEYVAPLFGLRNPPSFPHLPVYRSRLPLDIVKNICRQVDYARVAHGDHQFSEGSHVDARSRYITALFPVLVHVFEGIISSRTICMASQRGRPATIENHFTVYNATTMLVMIQKGRGVRNNFIAQLLAECEAADFENSRSGYWVPIIAVLCDSENFQFFVYDSSDRKFYASELLPNFPKSMDENECLEAVRIAAELLYDLFLLSFINGLRFNLARTEPLMVGVGAEDHKARFRSALPAAETALERSRYAARMAEDIETCSCSDEVYEVESLTGQAFQEVKESVGNAPKSGCVWQYMRGWDDEQMMRC